MKIKNTWYELEREYGKDVSAKEAIRRIIRSHIEYKEEKAASDDDKERNKGSEGNG